MNKIVECVPNFSEGRDLQKIDWIVAPFRGRQGVKLLDYSNDEDHNRLVVTVVGEPEPLRDAVLEAIGVAVRFIDLNVHQGQHPRDGGGRCGSIYTHQEYDDGRSYCTFQRSGRGSGETI